MSAGEWVIVLFSGLGTLFMFFAALGLVRLPDVYSRLHSTGKSATGGVIMTMLAAVMYFIYYEDVFIVKLILTILFVFLTTPIVTLLVARSAYRSGVPLEKNAIVDELKEEDERKKEAEKN